MIVTIDGPAGTGKSTVAKEVARALAFTYFDTGAMYRTVTWLLLKNHISFEDQVEIDRLLDQFDFRIERKGTKNHYYSGDREVTEEIRSTSVTTHVSAVSALPAVRHSLWKIQHRFAEKGKAVFEGRDLGTMVFPDAEVKIFLTASPEVRARRRLLELQEKRPEEAALLDLEQMRLELMRRDELDTSRLLAPLKCPEDAYIIDTSHLSINQVVEHILHYIKGKDLLGN